MLTREQMAMRVAQELRDGDYVNLGIGIPTLVANYIPAGIEVMLQSENGLLGMGEFPDEETIDADMINAGKQTVTAQTGAAIFDSAQSFAMIRGGHVDLTVLGAFEVDVAGNIASWMIPRKNGQGDGRRHGPGGRRAEHHRGDDPRLKKTANPNCCRSAPCRSPAWAVFAGYSPIWPCWRLSTARLSCAKWPRGSAPTR